MIKRYLNRMVKPTQSKAPTRKGLEKKLKQLEERRAEIADRARHAGQVREQALNEVGRVSGETEPTDFADQLAGFQAKIDSASRQASALQEARQTIEEQILSVRRDLVPLIEADLMAKQTVAIEQAAEEHRLLAVAKKRARQAEKRMDGKVADAQDFYDQRARNLRQLYGQPEGGPHLTAKGGQILGPLPADPRSRYPVGSTY